MNRITTSVLTLLALTASVAAQDPIDLSTTAKAGASAYFVAQEKNAQTMDMGGQKMESGQVISRTFKVTVKAAGEDGSVTVELETLRVHGSMQIPMMGEQKFDSQDKGADDGEDDFGMGLGAMTAQMTGMAGHKFEAKVGRDGVVSGDVKVLGTDDQQAAGKDHVDQAKELIEAAFGRRPTEKVELGKKWEFKEEKAATKMPMQGKIEATLTEATAEQFTVKITGTMTKGEVPEDAGDSEEAQMAAEMLEGMEIKNGKVTGEMKLSRTDGMTTSSTTRVTADIAIDSPMGAMDMTMDGTRTVTRTTAEQAMPKKAEKPAETGK